MFVNQENNAARRVMVLDADANRTKKINETLRVLNYVPLTPRDAADWEGLGANSDVAVMLGDLPAGQSVNQTFLDFSAQNPLPPVLRLSGATTTSAIDERLDDHFNWELDAALKTSQVQFLLNRAERYKGKERLSRITGKSAAVRQVRELIEKVADFDTTVLVTGESGTGKELAAQMVHQLSRRSEKPFVPINCGAIPAELLESELFGHEKGAFTGALSTRKGRFELAEGGTIFLDEIGDMSLEMQAKLLRILQERCYERVGGTETRHCDIRVVAATHQDLKARVASGDFREDLFFRLHVFPVEMPPLRKRICDLPLLIGELLVRHQPDVKGQVQITPNARRALHNYSWPGNIRELNNLIERLSILHPSGIVDSPDLPARYRQAGETVNGNGKPEQVDFEQFNLKDRLEGIEKQLIRSALAESDNVVAGAARLLNLRRTTLVEKISKFGLHA